MKKPLIFVLVGVVMVAGIAFAIMSFMGPGKVGELEALVPADAIYYFYSYQPSKKIDDFCNSDFFQKISSLSFYQEFAQPNLDKKERTFKILREVYNSDSAIAIFSPGMITPKGVGTQGMDIEIGEFLLLVRMDIKKNIKKTIGDLYLQFSDDEEVDYSTYKGIKITHYEIPMDSGFLPSDIELTISYAVLGDVLVAGNNKGLLKKSIDLFKKDNSKSLLNNEIYKKAAGVFAKQKKDSFLWSFINQKQYSQEFMDQIDDLYMDEEQARQMGNFMKGFMDISIASASYIGYDRNKKGFFGETHQLFNKDNDQQHFLDIFSSKGEKNGLVGIIPADLFVYLGVTGDLTGCWDYFYQLLSATDKMKQNPMGANQYKGYTPPTFSESFRMFETYLGLNIEKDIIPLLGDDISLVISDLQEMSLAPSSGKINPMQFFPTPIPTLSLLLEAKDEASAKKLKTLIVGKVAQLTLPMAQGEALLEILEQNYSGTEISLIAIKNSPIEPVCLSIGRNFIISSSMDYAKKVINIVKNNSDSLGDNLDFTFDKKNLYEKGASVFIIEFADLINALAKTKVVNFAKPSVALFTQGKVTASDIDDVIDILNDISIITQASDISSEGIGRGVFYLGIEGL